MTENTQQPSTDGPEQSARTAREQREAEALRLNLLRRKTQKRALSAVSAQAAKRDD